MADVQTRSSCPLCEAPLQDASMDGLSKHFTVCRNTRTRQEQN